MVSIKEKACSRVIAYYETALSNPMLLYKSLSLILLMGPLVEEEHNPNINSCFMLSTTLASDVLS